MNTIIVQARTGSSRLPNKIFKQIGEITVLKYLINRIKLSKNTEQIIIATTDNIKDKKIIDFCNNEKIKYYIGDEQNVLKRFYDCALHFKATTIIRITSDCPFADPEIIDIMINKFHQKNIDYISNTTPPETSNWPDGSDVEILSFSALERSYNETKNKKEQEHVTFYIWKNRKTNFQTSQYQYPNDCSKFRFTIDYEEDLIVANKIDKYLKANHLRGSIDEIINFLELNPTVSSINNKYYFGIGWK